VEKVVSRSVTCSMGVGIDKGDGLGALVKIRVFE
jgi:hypothetical protein